MGRGVRSVGHSRHASRITFHVLRFTWKRIMVVQNGFEPILQVCDVVQNPTRHWARAFIEGVTLVLQVLAVVSLLLSGVLVLNTLMALITQQTNQIGILKAIGGTSSTVLKVYLSGVLVYGALALVLSLPPSGSTRPTPPAGGFSICSTSAMMHFTGWRARRRCRGLPRWSCL
jgi:FtsX-like permease family